MSDREMPRTRARQDWFCRARLAALIVFASKISRNRERFRAHKLRLSTGLCRSPACTGPLRNPPPAPSRQSNCLWPTRSLARRGLIAVWLETGRGQRRSCLTMRRDPGRQGVDVVVLPGSAPALWPNPARCRPQGRANKGHCRLACSPRFRRQRPDVPAPASVPVSKNCGRNARHEVRPDAPPLDAAGRPHNLFDCAHHCVVAAPGTGECHKLNAPRQPLCWPRRCPGARRRVRGPGGPSSRGGVDVRHRLGPIGRRCSSPSPAAITGGFARHSSATGRRLHLSGRRRVAVAVVVAIAIAAAAAPQAVAVEQADGHQRGAAAVPSKYHRSRPRGSHRGCCLERKVLPAPAEALVAARSGRGAGAARQRDKRALVVSGPLYVAAGPADHEQGGVALVSGPAGGAAGDDEALHRSAQCWVGRSHGDDGGCICYKPVDAQRLHGPGDEMAGVAVVHCLAQLDNGAGRHVEGVAGGGDCRHASRAGTAASARGDATRRWRREAAASGASRAVRRRVLGLLRLQLAAVFAGR